jgi:hypothetical protein
MIERPSPGEQIAGIAGLTLILTMFLFAWFGVDVPGVNGFDAFDAFSDWFNIILVFAAFAGMALALVGSGAERSPVSLSVVTTVLGGIGTIVLLIYIISPPGIPTFGEAAPEIDLDREFGVFLGLIELVALTVGGYMTMQEEGVSFGSAADRLSDSGTHQPPQHQQPPPPPPPAQQPGQPQQAPPPPPPPAQQPPPPPAPPQQPPPPPPPPTQQYQPPPPPPPPPAG